MSFIVQVKIKVSKYGSNQAVEKLVHYKNVPALFTKFKEIKYSG